MAQNVMLELSKKYDARRALDADGNEKFVKTGSVILDAVLSNGKGVPLNKFIQISSESGLGKTTIILHCCKALCAQGYEVAYIDIEKGVNESQMEGIGLTKYLNNGFFLYPISTFEEAEDVMDTVLANPKLGYIVIDSITALIPAKVLEKSISELEPGINARYSAQFLTKYKAKISMSDCQPTVFYINQMRTKLNFRGMTTYGAAGGSAQKFYCDIRLMMKLDKALERQTNTMEGKCAVQYGSNNRIWAEKNRYNKPFIEGVITVIFGKGVSNISAYQRVLMSKGVLTMAGAGFWTLALPDKEVVKDRGAEGVERLIRNSLKDVKSYVEANGGFELFESEVTED